MDIPYDILKNAIHRNEFYIVYQPIYNLSSGKMVGVEALVRWQHFLWGHVPTHIFIPAAEQAEIIHSIGSWVLKSVCKQAACWYKQGFDHFAISINISPQQLLAKDFLSGVKNILHKIKIPPETFISEITETTVMPHFNVDTDISHLSYSEQILKSITELGISISLDDFGTGHSSLIYLSRLPIKGFKIDKLFIQDIHNNHKNASIVNNLINLSHDLDLIVTAEGIENIEQLNHLGKHNCHLGQGFFLSKPLSAEEMYDLLKKNFVRKINKKMD